MKATHKGRLINEHRDEDLCQLPFRNISFMFLWPDLKPNDLNNLKFFGDKNLITVFITPVENKNKQTGHQLYLDRLVSFIAPKKYYNENYKNKDDRQKEEMLAGIYKDQYDLYYQAVYDEKRQTKTYDYFWIKDSKTNNIDAIIMCSLSLNNDVLGYGNTSCSYNRYKFVSNLSLKLEVSFDIDHIANWKEIADHSFQLLDSFMVRSL